MRCYSICTILQYTVHDNGLEMTSSLRLRTSESKAKTQKTLDDPFAVRGLWDETASAASILGFFREAFRAAVEYDILWHYLSPGHTFQVFLTTPPQKSLLERYTFVCVYVCIYIYMVKPIRERHSTSTTLIRYPIFLKSWFRV